MDETARLAKSNRAAVELRETEAAFQMLKAALTEKLYATPLENTLLREKIYMAVSGAEAMRDMLRQAVSDGEMVNYTTLLAEHGFQR